MNKGCADGMLHGDISSRHPGVCLFLHRYCRIKPPLQQLLNRRRAFAKYL